MLNKEVDREVKLLPDKFAKTEMTPFVKQSAPIKQLTASQMPGDLATIPFTEPADPASTLSAPKLAQAKAKVN